ncbi:MAG: iron transporter substrate-binding protein [Devosia sp.]|nr:iron transporter substrate-binding protein [Devosia sp.]
MTLHRLLGTTISIVALAASTLGASAQTDMAALEAAAKAEGQLTVIALPASWCGYGEVISTFKAKYPEITVNELNPDAGSADELEAIRANIGNTGPQAPDVIDVGLAFGPQAQEEKLIQPYKVSTWDSIPADAKDADGYWYGDYYGVMAFLVNTDIIPNPPTSFADLMKPEYANSFALAGPPRTANQGIQGVLAAGLATNGGDLDTAAAAGLEFFKKLNDAGNFVPVTGNASPVAQGTTPIVAAWDYNTLAWRDGFAGNPATVVVVPSDVTLAGVYVQAISAHAPHPNAAKLWMEYLYSDEGQLGWLKGYCHPIRFTDMSERGVIPQDLLDALPPAEAYAKAIFPSLAQINAARETITTQWDTVVGANVE